MVLAVKTLRQCSNGDTRWQGMTPQALVAAVRCVEHFCGQLGAAERCTLRTDVWRALSSALLLVCDVQCTFLQCTFAERALGVVGTLGLRLPAEVLERVLLGSPCAALRALCARTLPHDAPTASALLALLPAACACGARAGEFFSLLGSAAEDLAGGRCSGDLGAALAALLSLTDEAAMAGAARLCTALCASASGGDVRSGAARCSDALLAALFDLTGLGTPRRARGCPAHGVRSAACSSP